jgi:hypothetical protein
VEPILFLSGGGRDSRCGVKMELVLGRSCSGFQVQRSLSVGEKPLNLTTFLQLKVTVNNPNCIQLVIIYSMNKVTILTGIQLIYEIDSDVSNFSTEHV